MKEYLFGQGYLSDVTTNLHRHIAKEISEMSEEKINSLSDKIELKKYIERYTLKPPSLDIENIRYDSREVKKTPNELYRGYGERTEINVIEISIYIPFKGDPQLFNYRGHSWVMSMPEKIIDTNNLVLKYIMLPEQVVNIEGIYKRDLGYIEQNLESVQNDSANFNAGLEKLVCNSVKERASRIQKTKATLENLGLPKRKKEIEDNQVLRDVPRKRSRKSDKTVSLKDVFLCHAGEDKDDYVRPFAVQLGQNNISYWLDEAELAWGDDLIHEINNGLAKSKYVIVFLSENFIGKGWPESEMNSALSIENTKKQIIVLPLFLCDPELVLVDYPLLRKKKYITWDLGISEIIKKLIARLNKLN
ncbi:toll/interleukin-1 receptor domain-containing protein [bacterium]|nr:toll/interleukin-1 receptor domain-containing protein [bacterium]